jgi:DNA mismatch endonuclease (patch repair protein)
MPDNLSPGDRQKTMRAVKSKGTKLERALFAMLAGMRLSGWRQNASDILGKPDAVFNARKTAIFVDGCFWHGCPICQRKLPQTNHEYWARKITRNVEHAQDCNQQLSAAGWAVVRIWEHEITDARNRQEIRARIRSAIASGEHTQ